MKVHPPYARALCSGTKRFELHGVPASRLGEWVGVSETGTNTAIGGIIYHASLPVDHAWLDANTALTGVSIFRSRQITC
jgi:hypothetical protein